MSPIDKVMPFASATGFTTIQLDRDARAFLAPDSAAMLSARLDSVGPVSY
jgi:hypothetical protein